ncbi:hypothetical protein EJ08DRAFT_149115 [Tothia fuscella]|uniref:U4/U6 snRNA-associated-splicing factor PRP24 n=1 Tax=Tothia fuscella TaxID=1048955 RepID=A0A9P4U4X7_9PEZI|nr:hypothetical protein EJ08DRAFT_149115 [Tothia fuscella]
MQQQQNAARQGSNAPQNQNINYNVRHLPRTISGRSVNDVTMTDSPSPASPRIFVAQALSNEDCQTITELHRHLVEKPFDFQGHVQFIDLLRKGFTGHSQNGSDPHVYELLNDLRDARSTMDKVFPLGERLWSDWLDDEKLLARNIDDRVKVMELFRRAITDELTSASLWRLYGDYMYYLWATTYDVNDEGSQDWSAEDKEIGKEVFKWEPMMAVWEQGVASTERRLNDSNTVWDRYIEMLIQDHTKWPSPQKLQNIKAKFLDRLASAHATWDNTSQMYSSFISSFEESAWEQSMVAMNGNQRVQQAKSLYAIREPHELNIETAKRNGDEAAEWAAYSEYLEWELRMQGVSSFPLINGLYERATIRFPSVATLWNDYVSFLVEHPSRDFPVLPVAERATRHCPWSGDLWSQRMLTMEAEGKDFTELEITKHDATATGLLDVGGLDELMKVYIAWCGCLRRRAFEPGATEDELDIAEVAIRSALEHVQEVAEKKHGRDYPGDPQYRLERIHIKFMTQRGDMEAGRAILRSLVATQANNYDFWYRYYIWEMVIWAKFAMRATNEPETQLQTPAACTAVLREALNYVATLDWPEQLITMFINHCEQHESVHELRKAVIEAGKVTKLVNQRREKEAADAAAAYQQQQPTQAVVVETVTNGKRKRDSEASADVGATKKNRSDNSAGEVVTPKALPARDREHAVITVKNLPMDATETKVRQFFRDCGTINSIKLAPEKITQVATIEFETEQDALFAQTKAVKPFEGEDLEIRFATGATLWVTNYPPEADLHYIRNLFKDYDGIVDVRLPSLQLNTRRRFCYVQFKTPEQAYNATQLHDQVVTDEQGQTYKLVVRISDPPKALGRTGALAEGREVYVSNVAWFAHEDEIKDYLSPAGEIEQVRIPKNLAGKSKGTAFVSFKDKISAENAVTRFNNTEFKKRSLHLEISKSLVKRSEKAHVGSDAGLPSVDAESPSAASDDMNGHSGSNAKARSLALLNVPDTVNIARIRRLFEKHGALVRCSLRTDHSGAFAEYVDESSVGRAQLDLEGKEIDGNIVRTGTIGELFEQKRQFKTSKLTDRKKPAPAPAASSANNFAPARPGRPMQNATRGGRKPGLGFKKAADSHVGEGEKQEGGKSNDYFRDLMAKGKGEGGSAEGATGGGDNMET